MQPATLNSMCTILVSNARTAQMLLSKGLGMPTKESPSMDPERLRVGWNSARKTSRKLTPTSISAGTKNNWLFNLYLTKCSNLKGTQSNRTGKRFIHKFLFSFSFLFLKLEGHTRLEVRYSKNVRGTHKSRTIFLLLSFNLLMPERSKRQHSQYVCLPLMAVTDLKRARTSSSWIRLCWDRCAITPSMTNASSQMI